MHIMEGFLPIEWCVLWFILAIPFVYLGARKIIELVRDNPEQKMTVALSGAFIFLLSSLKLPSVTGSSSHPTGTGFSTAVHGVFITSFLSMIVLIFQSILLAHGGLTTLGANIFSMGIAGPGVAYLIWVLLRKKLNVKIPIVMFIVAFVANLVTYVVTAIQLTLAFGADAGYMTAFTEFMSIFAMTQVPIGVIEGILFAIFSDYLCRVRPSVFGLESGGEAEVSEPIPEVVA